LILEDDAEILPNALTVIPRCLRDMQSGWDLLTVGFEVWNQPNVLFSWDWHADPQPVNVYEHLMVPPGGFQTTAWIWSPKGAREMLSKILPWTDPYDYVEYRKFLLSKGYEDDYPTPGSLDLFMQMQFGTLQVYHCHAAGARVIRESPKFISSICRQGRRL
jgi:hypothetical protein